MTAPFISLVGRMDTPTTNRNAEFPRQRELLEEALKCGVIVSDRFDIEDFDKTTGVLTVVFSTEGASHFIRWSHHADIIERRVLRALREKYGVLRSGAR